MKPEILLVDDEENILAGYRRNLRDSYQIHIALGGQPALDILEANKNIAVVVSDYKMPGMNGVEFLSKVKDSFPETMRVMLTGYAELDAAIKAVNEGSIFRFLSKPCANDILRHTLDEALEIYRLKNAEKELLNKTLKGSINVLVDILSITNPIAFSKTNRMRDLATNIAKKLGITNLWEVEISALLSQIGYVAVPSEILLKKINGNALDEEELKIYNSNTEVAQSLLQNIPRLEKISRYISLQHLGFRDESGVSEISGRQIPIVSRILKVLNDYESFIASGMESSEAFNKLRQNDWLYDAEVLTALDTELAGIYDGLTLFSVNLNQLKPGVVLADNIRDTNGTILLTKGAELNRVSIVRLLNYSKMTEVLQPIKVLEQVN